MRWVRRVLLPLSATTLTTQLIFSLGVGVPVLFSAEAPTVSPSPPSGQAIDYHPDNRTLTVHLNGLPLDQVMDELSKQTHIRFRPPDQGKTFDSRPVTASFERMPIERAIKQLLGPSNTAMIYGMAHTAGQAAQPGLTEVRVLDLGVIPSAVQTGSIDDGRERSPVIRLSPEELQARREALQKRRDEKQAHSNNRRGGGGGRGNSSTTNQAASQDTGGQSSEQSGGQSSGNGGNGSNTPGGQTSNSGSKQNGSTGGKQ